MHKAMLAVVVADVDGDWQFARRQCGATPSQLRLLTEWLVEHEVEEVVMESTAQYSRPVWDALERESNHGRPGRKRDFPDAERLVKRLVAHELTLSFVPDVTQRLWRTVTRRKYQRNRVQLQNRLESLLEEAHLKVSALVSDLLGASARRMLRAIATGETDPAALAALGSPRLHATPEQLADALGAAADMPPLYRRLLVMTLAELDLLESHMLQLDEELAALLRVHQAAVQRLTAVPGFGSIRRNRSSRKSAPRQRPFRPPSNWPHGWAPAPATMRAPASTAVIASQTAIVKRGDCSTSARTRR